MIDALYLLLGLSLSIIALLIKYEYDNKYNNDDYDN